MPEYIRKSTALNILEQVSNDLQTVHSNVHIFRKTNTKDRPGSSFGIENNEYRYINIDTRPVQNTIRPFIPLQTIMHTCLELYHEEGHLIQFEQKFKQNDPISKHLAQTTIISRCMPNVQSKTWTTPYPNWKPVSKSPRSNILPTQMPCISN